MLASHWNWKALRITLGYISVLKEKLSGELSDNDIMHQTCNVEQESECMHGGEMFLNVNYKMKE